MLKRKKMEQKNQNINYASSIAIIFFIYMSSLKGLLNFSIGLVRSDLLVFVNGKTGLKVIRYLLGIRKLK